MPIPSNTTHENATVLRTEQTVAAILSHPTLAKSARALGINEATLWRRMQAPELRCALQDARRRISQQTLLRLQTTFTGAIDTLSEIMNNVGESGSTRVSAARTLLDAAAKALEADELRQRIECLERLIRK